ncbi:YoaK family protein [Streptomyces cavernae]|uniref:YoaK family protein n=1 Tax=Streptomyces cavernae TaxID=2259034 RepID=UPI001EE4C880|nr:YoaK family protein [Streptomyces cavernae]
MKPTPPGGLTAVMVALTLTTGAVEAVSFLVLGPVFTAIQTGNLLFLGFAVAGEGDLSAASSAVSLGAFVVGVMLGSRFESGQDLRGRRWFVRALSVEAVLLAAAGLTAWDVRSGGEPLSVGRCAVIATVAAAMGMRNVTTMRVGVPDLTTTVATRTLTAFLGGSPLAPDTRITSGTRNEGHRAAAIGAMFTGGLLGAWLLHEGVRPAVVLLIAAAGVLATAVVHGLAPRHRAT